MNLSKIIDTFRTYHTLDDVFLMRLSNGAHLPRLMSFRNAKELMEARTSGGACSVTANTKGGRLCEQDHMRPVISRGIQIPDLEIQHKKSASLNRRHAKHPSSHRRH